MKKKVYMLRQKKLFISPQGLGRIIQNLESEFGTTFFNRTKTVYFPRKAELFFMNSV